jgi:membrane-bound lytic murein transglycosylase B
MACFLAAFSPALAAGEKFDAWLQGVRKEGLARGIKQSTLDSALTGLQVIPRVVELDRKQPEFTLTFDQYMSRVVSARRVKKGRAKYRENRELLDEIGKRYGVQPRFIVALWGIETDFGRLTGGFKVVAALATLAFDGRRSAYFRKQLFNALTIIDQGHITAAKMMGSWAGAMGQSQFMPSSFLNFAVDYDGDGRRDIWTNRADVFASAANYLKQAGWRGDQTWGRAATLPADFDVALLGLKTRKRLSEWQRLGVRRADGGDLPARDLRASLVRPKQGESPVYLVYDNYRAILKWNRAHLFATAVGTLADRVGGK